MASAPIEPARLALGPDGVPWSSAYGDVYHSSDGGEAQARHVFLAGNGLPARWRGRAVFVILETGFGLGLNFLTAWDAFRRDTAATGRLHFISIEKHPFTATDLAVLHQRWPHLAALAEQLRARWPSLVPGFHRLHFDDGRVTLTLILGDIATCLPKLVARVDAFFLDGFSPARNPDMWSGGVFSALAALAADGATLATWSVSSAVRSGLALAGFQLSKRPGFGRKREMLCGDIGGRPAATPAPAIRHALVVGAGLAGCAVSERLAARGWQIDLVDRHPQPAAEASGNLAGLLRPLLSRDDNIASRLSRAAFLYTLRHWRMLETAGAPLQRRDGGLLHLARDADHEAQQRQALAAQWCPADYARFVDRDEAGRLAGRPLPAGGWFFPEGQVVNPPSYCEAQLWRGGDRIRRHFPREGVLLARVDGLWHLSDADGRCIASAPVAILAGGASAALEQVRGLPIRRVRGQVTHLPPGQLGPLARAVCRDGYVTPEFLGAACVGASYDETDAPDLRPADHAANLQRLEAALPGAAAGLDAAALDGRVGFRAVAADRLPLAGAVPEGGDPLRRAPGLYAAMGYGSRGILWSALCAELLACLIEDEPLPIESDLAAAVDPARFLLRARRRR